MQLFEIVAKDECQYPNCMTSLNKELQQINPSCPVSILQALKILRRCIDTIHVVKTYYTKR